MKQGKNDALCIISSLNGWIKYGWSGRNTNSQTQLLLSSLTVYGYKRLYQQHWRLKKGFKLNVSYVRDLIKADDCILIILQEAGCHGHGRAPTRSSVSGWTTERNRSQSRTNVQRSQRTVFVKSPQSDPDFGDAGWFVRFDAGHLNVSVEAGWWKGRADIRSGTFTIKVSFYRPRVKSVQITIPSCLKSSHGLLNVVFVIWNYKQQTTVLWQVL